MKNIVMLFAVLIFLFSCKKNQEGVDKMEVSSVTGNWSAAYLNKSIQLSIDKGQGFQLNIPLVVKKESNAAPVVLNISLKGICVREDAGYVLSVDALDKTAEAGNNSLDEIKRLVVQSLEGAEVSIERSAEGAQKLSARLTADNGKLLVLGL